MKSLLAFTSLLLVSFQSYTQLVHLVFTNQPTIDNYTFLPNTYYRIEFRNDTNLAIHQQINDISAIAIIDSLELSLTDTRVPNLTFLNSHYINRVNLFRNYHLDSLVFKDGVEFLYGLYIEDNYALTHIGGMDSLKLLTNIEIFDNPVLETVDLGMYRTDSIWYSPKIKVENNKQLRYFKWNNPHHVLDMFNFYGNPNLKHIHLATVLKGSGGKISSKGIINNAKLDSITGFQGLDSLGYIGIYDNPNLNDICVFKLPIKLVVNANPIDSLKYNIHSNGPSLQNFTQFYNSSCGAVSVPKYLNSNALLIYPNPAKNYIKVTGISGQQHYTIYNLSGSILKNGYSSNEREINIQELSSGVYFMELEGNYIRFVVE